MSGAVREGDRVRVRGMNGRVLYHGTVHRLMGNLASVIPEGKAKPRPVPLGRVSPEERKPPHIPMTFGDLGGVKPHTTARPEHSPVPRPRPPARDSGYLAFVRSKPCVACGSTRNVEAHHWGWAKKGLGEKVSDYRTIPLCAEHHQLFHTTGQIDPFNPKATRVLFVVRQVDLLEEWLTREEAAA